jgi:hypothetical protein
MGSSLATMFASEQDAAQASASGARTDGWHATPDGGLCYGSTLLTIDSNGTIHASLAPHAEEIATEADDGSDEIFRDYPPTRFDPTDACKGPTGGSCAHHG